jgi:hypothetical protein
MEANMQAQRSLNNTASIQTTQQTKAKLYLCGELPVTLHLSDANAPDRQALEAFIRTRFYAVHQAHIEHFMPEMLSLRDENHGLRAVCGLRHANEGPLFLEHYFEWPIEQVLSTSAQQTIERKAILEIGNLAVLEPACIRSLLASISVYLHHTNTEWAVFTGIPSLINALKKLQMTLLVLGSATIDHLPEHEHAAWGNYYQLNPQVIAIPRMLSGY